MNKEPQRINITPLAHDYIYAYEKVSGFYCGDFRDLSAYKNQAKKIKSQRQERETLAAVLREQNQLYGCDSQTLRNIDKLIQNQTCAVVTGQQVGLFSGPLYTVYKSLSAIKLAEYLNQNCQGNFVPVFWLASDDHDFAEIDHIILLDKDNRIEEVRYRSSLSHKKIPAYGFSLTEEIEECIQHLDDSTRDSEFKSDIIAHLNDAYQPDRSFAEAFARWMTRLFKSCGLIFVDASHPALKELGKKVFSREISENSPSTKQALESSARLAQSGYQSQVQLHEGILNVFLALEERHTIRSENGGFLIQDLEQTYKKSELLALLEEKPYQFSPNVLLRSIYQDTLFPTVAYVGGPGEIAYFAQMKGVYESFDLPMPIIFPRATVTIAEKNIEKVLKRYNIKIQDIWHDTDRVINEIIKKQVPDSLDKIIGAAASHLERDFESIEQELMAFEPTLKKSADLALGRMNQQLRFLEKKIMQATKKRNSVVIGQLYRAKNSLYPLNHLQERAFNIVPYLIKYSYALMDRLYQAIDIANHEHQIIKL